jgi:hypothetical protein
VFDIVISKLFPLHRGLTLNGVLEDFVQKRDRDKWGPVTTAWRVLRLRVEERPAIWRVAANILNMQTRTADKGWSSSFGFGRDADNSSPKKLALLRNINVLLGRGLIVWYDLCSMV